MADKLTLNLAAFDSFVTEKGWSFWGQKDIEYGRQVTVIDGVNRLPVNFYNTGKILLQGKSSEMKTAIAEWANLQQAGIKFASASVLGEVDPRQNRIARYLVIPDRIELIRDVISHFPAEVTSRDLSGPAESYRVEISKEGQRLTITQYTSGTLMIQGLSSPLLEEVCEVLDEHLTQSFAARATRFIPGEIERAAATPYLESPDAENEAACWLFEQIDKNRLNFLYLKDQHTLLAAAGVRNSYQKPNQSLPDYSVIVMPFAKAYEGFLIKLAVHLGLTTEEALSQKANVIKVGEWLEAIKARLPDIKRYSEMADTLSAAWGCRNKAVHSDFAYAFSVLESFTEADQEISTILRAMARANRVFVEDNVKLVPVQALQEGKTQPADESEIEHKFEKVDRELLRKQLEADNYTVKTKDVGRKNLWGILDMPNLKVIVPRNPEGPIVVEGKKAKDFCEQYTNLLGPNSIPHKEKL